MTDVADRLDAFVSEAADMASKVDSEVADRENDPRSMCFWNIRNRALITQEIIGFYGKAWNGDESTGQEMSERLMVVTRDMFVDVVSSVEKAARDCMRLYEPSGIQAKASEQGGRMYLRDIMGASAELGYIDKEELDAWDRILLMRNLTIHNNSVSDRSDVFVLGDLRISMRPNRMMKGPPSTFVILSSETLMLFYRWLMAVHRSRRHGSEGAVGGVLPQESDGLERSHGNRRPKLRKRVGPGMRQRQDGCGAS